MATNSPSPIPYSPICHTASLQSKHALPSITSNILASHTTVISTIAGHAADINPTAEPDHIKVSDTHIPLVRLIILTVMIGVIVAGVLIGVLARWLRKRRVLARVRVDELREGRADVPGETRGRAATDEEEVVGEAE